MGSCNNSEMIEEVAVLVQSIEHKPNTNCYIKANNEMYVIRKSNPEFDRFRKLLKKNNFYIFEYIEEQHDKVVIDIEPSIKFSARIENIKKNKNGTIYITTNSEKYKKIRLNPDNLNYDFIQKQIAKGETMNFDLDTDKQLIYAERN